MSSTRIITNCKDGEDVPLVTAIPRYDVTAPTEHIDEAESSLVNATEVGRSAVGVGRVPAAIAQGYNNCTHNDFPRDMYVDRPIFRDVWAALLFWCHLLVMLAVGIFIAPQGYQTIPQQFNSTALEDALRQGDDVTEKDLDDLKQVANFVTDFVKVYPYRIYVYLVMPSLLISFVVAFLVTTVIIRPCPKPIVYTTLLISLAITTSIMISSAVAVKSIPFWLLTGLSIAGVAYYVHLAWRTVPFAACNLKVALQAISSNWGMYIVAFVFSELGFLWNLFWLYVLVGLWARQGSSCLTKHLENDPLQDWESDTDDDDINWAFFLGLLLSFYWTSTVLMNTVQTTVSGVVATWCFVSNEADKCCSPAVTGSLFRSLTFSFGSICFGSLLQAIVSALRSMLESVRNRQEQEGDQDLCGSLCFCVLDCLFKCFGDLLDYFNQWSYCYVGIYGTSYLESGKRVLQLFRARGWTTIISDNLVGYALGMVSIVVGIVTGFGGVILDKIANRSDSSFLFGPVEGTQYFSFAICFLVGLWVCSVMMSVIKGAVNALIVCWADSPAKLEHQHPVLTSEMADAWDSVFPEANVQSPTFMFV